MELRERARESSEIADGILNDFFCRISPRGYRYFLDSFQNSFRSGFLLRSFSLRVPSEIDDEVLFEMFRGILPRVFSGFFVCDIQNFSEEIWSKFTVGNLNEAPEEI